MRAIILYSHFSHYTQTRPDVIMWEIVLIIRFDCLKKLKRLNITIYEQNGKKKLRLAGLFFFFFYTPLL